MKKKWIALGLCFATYSSAAFAFSSLPYLPLVDGNSWTYRTKTNGTVTGTDTAIVASSLFNGQSTKSVTYASGEIDYYTNDVGGIKLYGGYVPPSSEIPYPSTLILTPAAQLVNSDIVLGAVVTKSGTASLNIAGFGTYTLSYTNTSVAQAMETVTVPAGTFSTVRVYSTLRLTGTILSQAIDQTTSTTDWLASGKGVVKELHMNGTQLEELVSTNVVKSLSNKNDLNGDGITDLIWRQASTGALWISFTGSTGNTTGWAGLGAAPDWTVTAIGDFNGDGIPDMLWRQTSTGSQGEVFMNSNGTVKGWNTISTGTDWSVVNTLDLNGDGITDLIWRQASTGALGISFTGSTGNTTGWAGLGAAPDWTVTGTGDFNGDGIPDMLWRQTSTGSQGEVFMNSNGTVKGWNTISTGTDWSVVNTLDLNGDGITDLIWRQASTGALGISFTGSTGNTTGWAGLGAAPDWTVTGTGDFNGDGVPDMLWRQTSTGSQGEVFMNSNGTVKGWNTISTGADWSVVGE